MNSDPRHDKLSVFWFLPRPGQFARGAGATVLAVVILSSIGKALQKQSDNGVIRTFNHLFWIDRERNVATLVNFTLLLVCSLVAFFMCRLVFRNSDRWTRHWGAIGVFFWLLSYDEAARVHETYIYPIRTMLNTSGALYFAWVIPAMVLVALLVVIFWRFVFAQPAKARNLMILSAIVYLGGAIATEMLGGLIATSGEFGTGSAAYYISVTIEETLEMTGLVIFAYAVLTRIHGYAAQETEAYGHSIRS